MTEEAGTPDILIHASDGCLIVPVHVELYDDSLSQLQSNLLAKLAETGAHGVVIDVSNVAVIDSFIGEALAQMAQMSMLLGARLVISGVRPSVAATLAEFEVALAGIRWAGTLDDGLQMLRPVTAGRGSGTKD
jgi:rsbT antagonist protein RsbS